MDESTASFLDKTDWRLTLHRKLEDCVNSEGTFDYPRRVKSLISTISANFPNWDAKTEVENKIKETEIKYNQLLNNWLDKNPTKSRAQKYLQEQMYTMSAYKEVFEFIKNMCAGKRMLLWGHKKVSGGTQMPYEEIKE